MMRDIVLHGALGREFGHSFRLDVASPQQALRALVLQVKGFRERLRAGHYRIVRGGLGRGHALDLDECKLNLGGTNEIHIVPIVAGAANGRNAGIGKILAGVALVALAVFLPAAALTIGTFSLASTIGGIGLSLALSGVASLLATPPKLSGGQAAADKRDSFLFGGQINVVAQGGPVPLVYGQFEVGSVVVSAGLETEQIGVTPPAPTLSIAILDRMKAGGQLH